MELECFLRSIEVPGLTALVTSNNDSILRTRDGKPAHTSFAYSPKQVKADIGVYQLKELPQDPEILADFRRYVEDYVNDDRPECANAFHLSNGVLWNVNNGLLTEIGYTVSFFNMREDKSF